jgi:hypothetical protein
MAIVSALLATVVLTGLGVALALGGLEESLLAGHDRAARALRLASESAARLAVTDATAAASWMPLSSIGSRFVEATMSPLSPWDGSPIDLAAKTALVQAETDASRRADEAARTWRLLSAGPFARAAPGSGCGPFYLIVWMADDGADIDGDPETDSNGILTLRADALGPDGGRATTLVSLQRTVVSGEPDRVRVLTIRPGR